MSKRHVLLVVLALGVPRASLGQPVLGPEFRVNGFTTNEQWQTAVAAAPDGRFVVVWTSLHQDGSDQGVFGQRYDATGLPAGAPFPVNTFTTAHQGSPSVAMDADGDFVVVWHGPGTDENFTYGVFGQRFDAAGNRVGSEFHVNQWTTEGQSQPAVAMDPAGNFIVVWESLNQVSPFANTDVYARRYDAAGNPLGSEFLVNQATTGFHSRAGVAVDAAGQALVVWHGPPLTPQAGNSTDILGRLYDAAGNPVAGEFTVNSTTFDAQSYPEVAAGPGQFVVSWRSPDVYGYFLGGVAARRISAAGVPQGLDFFANTYTTGAQRGPSVGVAPDGSFLVAWGSQPHQDGSSEGVFARRFTAAGAPSGPEFRVNSYTTGAQSYPAVASRGPGHFMVAWSGTGPDDFAGVFARAALDDLIFKDGFESGDLTAWSASATGGGDLHVAGPAALNATAFGLRGQVDDIGSRFVEDRTPRDERRYRARFYLDPNGFDPGEAQNHRRIRLFVGFKESPSRRVFALVLRRVAGQFGLMGRARLDDNSQRDSGFFDITDGPHWVEIDWRAASAPGAADGALELWIDGAPMFAASDLANAAAEVDFVRLGALNVKGGAGGTLHWDEFESRRLTAIGP
jgi:hypothetical protein